MKDRKFLFIIILFILVSLVGLSFFNSGLSLSDYFYSARDSFYSGFNYLKEKAEELVEKEAVRVNYLIPGVPYYGFYNHYFQLQLELPRSNPTVLSSVVTLLAYWGDNRFDLADLAEEFPSGGLFSTKEMEEFFIKNDYQTYRWTSRTAGGEIDEIKKFINPGKKVPVIIFQRASFEPVSPFLRYHLGIGVFDQDQKIVVHDYYFGNNYEISYDDFEEMFSPNARSILAVWPSEELKEIIEEPNHQVAYPVRLENMDKIGNLLVTKRARANQYAMSDEFEKAEELSLYEDYFNDPSFKYLPPALQVFELCFWAVYYSEDPDKMIEIITERILPINHNLDEAPEGWILTPQDKFVYPYYLLSQAYLKKGERDLALQAYNEAKQIEVINKDWYQSILEELEAEFSQ